MLLEGWRVSDESQIIQIHVRGHSNSWFATVCFEQIVLRGLGFSLTRRSQIGALMSYATLLSQCFVLRGTLRNNLFDT